MPAPEIIQQQIKREMNAVDKAIDRLVYALSRKGMIYGLTDEKVKIVED